MVGETEQPRENPRRHGENIQTPHRKVLPQPGIKPRWGCEVTMLTTTPLCCPSLVDQTLNVIWRIFSLINMMLFPICIVQTSMHLGWFLSSCNSVFQTREQATWITMNSCIFSVRAHQHGMFFFCGCRQIFIAFCGTKRSGRLRCAFLFCVAGLSFYVTAEKQDFVVTECRGLCKIKQKCWLVFEKNVYNSVCASPVWGQLAQVKTAGKGNLDFSDLSSFLDSVQLTVSEHASLAEHVIQGIYTKKQFKYNAKKTE